MSNTLKIAILLCVGATALAIGSAARGEAAAESLVFRLKEKHDSRISGTATITPAGTGLRVILRLRGPVRSGTLAHIHTGPCRREPTFVNPRIWEWLSTLRGRTSVTTVDDTALAKLQARPFSINVHDPGTLGVVACGDIPPAK